MNLRKKDCGEKLPKRLALGIFVWDHPIWTRKHEFSWNGRSYRQNEVYYLVQADYFDPVMDVEAAPGEASAFRGFHWWSIDAIARSVEKFAPRNLHCLLESISKNGAG